MSIRENPYPCIWWLVTAACLVLAMVALLPVALTGWNLYSRVTRDSSVEEPLREPFSPSTELCNPFFPDFEDCDLLEMLEDYDDSVIKPPHDPLVAIGPVLRNGVPSHNLGGFNEPWWVRDYSRNARITTPEGYVDLAQCPEAKDGIEAMEVLAEFMAAATPEERSKIDLQDRA